MKKLIGLLSSAVAIFVLSGCSGTGEERIVTDTVIYYESADPAPAVTETEYVYVPVVETGGEDVYEEVVENSTTNLDAVDIMKLDQGYVVRGYSSYGNDVELLFYDGRYTYNRLDGDGVVRESFHGYFELENGAIKIYFGDDDGGGYAIETHNGFLEKGYFYNILGVRDNITVLAIYRDISL